tara:strand:+ start:7045 stop:7338 length:294 start_codon:yes stop_codon:yes gene_type:complete
MPATHRDTDPRTCGATTIVEGQSTVFINSLLQSVNGDPNTHGAGNLIAACKNVFVGGILCVNHTPDNAAADNLCPPLGGAHCAPATAGGSPDVFIGD